MKMYFLFFAGVFISSIVVAQEHHYTLVASNGTNHVIEVSCDGNQTSYRIQSKSSRRIGIDAEEDSNIECVATDPSDNSVIGRRRWTLDHHRLQIAWNIHHH